MGATIYFPHSTMTEDNMVLRSRDHPKSDTCGEATESLVAC